MHKCQGMSQLLPLPGVSEGFGSGPRGYRLRDTVLQGGVNRADPEMFDGVDTSLASLAGYAGPTPPVALTDGLSTIATRVADARTAVFSTGSAEAVAPLAAGLRAVRALRADLKSWSLPASGAYEIDIRLALKETQFQQALRAGGRRAARCRGQRQPGRRRSTRPGPDHRRQPRPSAGHAGRHPGRIHRRDRRLRGRAPGATGRAQLPHDRHRPDRCAVHRRALQVRRRRRALRFRSRRAARPAVPAHAVCRHRGADHWWGSRVDPGAGCRRARKAISSAGRSAPSCTWCRSSPSPPRPKS